MKHIIKMENDIVKSLEELKSIESSIYIDIEKSKKFPLQGKIKIHGLDISVENRKGSVRRGEDSNGKKWKTKMIFPYGYFLGVKGQDKEHLDVYVGDDRESENVFIVNQVNPFKKDKPFDEHKVMIGFENAKKAKEAYLKHYNSKDFFGTMIKYDINDFKKKIGFGEKGVKKVTKKTFLKKKNK